MIDADDFDDATLAAWANGLTDDELDAEVGRGRVWWADQFATLGSPTEWPEFQQDTPEHQAIVLELFTTWCADPTAFVNPNGLKLSPHRVASAFTRA